MAGVATARTERLLSVLASTQGSRAALMGTLPWVLTAGVRMLYPRLKFGLMVAGQAQYLRVPYADFNALKLPPGTEHEADFILLADIFPTGWHGIEISGFQPGDSVAVFGAGPVGLMAAYSAQIRGASRVYVVDRVPERLRAAEKIGAVPIDFTAGDAVDQIITANGGEMVDRSVDAVGYQAVSGTKDNATEVPNIVLENMIRVTRACGGLGIPGLYVPRFVVLLCLEFGVGG